MMEHADPIDAGQGDVERLTSSQTDFRRELGLFDGINVVIGNSIGSGIFIAPAVVAATILPQTGGIHLLVWLVGGLLALTGALSYAELGALMPRAGGHYVYLREGIGDLGGFLYGWTILLVIASGSIAFVSITFVTYLSYFVPMSPWLIKSIAIATILGLTGVNYVGVKAGSVVLNVFTGLKVIALVVLIVAGLLFASLHREYFLPLIPEGTELNLVWVSTFMFALVSALFTYGGWQNIGFIAGEMKNPRRNLPISLIIGVAIVIVIYMLTNMVYINVLGVPAMAGSQLVASDTMEGLWGRLGGSFVALLIMISSFGITNAIIMVSPRVYYAMSKDGLFLPQLACVHPRFKTPHIALVFQAVWASVIVLASETFQQIMNYVVFMDWLFLALAVYCIYVLRKKYPDAPRPYRAWGYPATPALFILLSMVVVVNTLMRAPLESGIGTAIVLSGLPFYYGMKSRLRRQANK
ncbi:MAG: amino acid permease [Bacteroidetes bacterium]|nr:amino acid permease [Bacteroidota bacterium]